MEKPFVVFRYDQYYPGGGWNDFFGRYATREEAEAAIYVDNKKYDYYDIVDVRDAEKDD